MTLFLRKAIVLNGHVLAKVKRVTLKTLRGSFSAHSCCLESKQTLWPQTALIVFSLIRLDSNMFCPLKKQTPNKQTKKKNNITFSFLGVSDSVESIIYSAWLNTIQ